MYNLYPKTKITADNRIFTNLDELKNEQLVVVETYPGVDNEVLEWFKTLGYDLIIETIDLFKDEKSMDEQLQPFLTDDRVRGKMYFGDVTDFMVLEKLQEAQSKIDLNKRILVYGFGASLVTSLGTLVYADLTRWEIQQRYRKGMPNYNASNQQQEVLQKYKRGYFVEWRLADKLKPVALDRMDYYLDTTIKGSIKMTTGDDYHGALDRMLEVPFRLVPYFDPGVWGGYYMKDQFNLPENNSNYAWSFDGVPEENSLNFEFGHDYIQTPAMNLTLMRPLPFLGKRIVERFGAEFPIRFDLLDTMGGQNLSLQVHPDVETIRKEFGMAYTQSESYYILESKPEGTVYLGVKENADKEEMFKELRRAQEGKKPFEADQYVNRYPAKKHDHFLIPPGTIHCSGTNTLVLEISHTPYIFTFKLWDWGRVDLDGKPRPTHIDLGERVLNMDYDTSYVEQHFINQSEVIYDDGSNKIEKTGLPPEQLIDTYRLHVDHQINLQNHGNVSMFNLVEGSSCVVEVGSYQLDVHYAETFIVPAAVEHFTIRCTEPVKLMRAQIR